MGGHSVCNDDGIMYTISDNDCVQDVVYVVYDVGVVDGVVILYTENDEVDFCCIVADVYHL